MVSTPARQSTRFGPIQVDYDERVLVPRIWTLEQSRWAAEVAATVGAGPILELCAGAGHIGLAAAVLTGRPLVQIEFDPVAGDYARFNAVRAGLDGRVEVRVDRLQTAVRPGELFPLIMADPPYLPTADLARWPDDPPTAIDGGEEGIDIVRDCLQVAEAHLSADGLLLLQVAGPKQADLVDELLRADARLTLRLLDRRVIDDERAIVLAGR